MSDAPLMTEECQESYQECMAARRARTEAVLAEAEPWETEAELAAKAEVTPRTVRRVKAALLQNRTGVLDCNKRPLIRLRELYDPDHPYALDREVQAEMRSFRKLSTEQLAWLFHEEYLPLLKWLQEGRYKNDYYDRKRAEARPAEAHPTDHGDDGPRKSEV